MKPGVAARVAAATALQRILDDGGHSNVVVHELREGLSRDDAGQLQRVVLATIRHLAGIDRILAEVTNRQPAALDPEVRAVLRAAVAELQFDAGDPHGVVNTAVEAVRSLGNPRATGFVNASLRRIVRDAPAAHSETFPQWISDRMTTQMGEEEAIRAMAALDTPAMRGIRIRSGGVPPGAKAVAGIPSAVYVESGVDVDIATVDFIDPASTAVVAAAGAEPGMDVLDVASAPGGKTAALWDAMNGEGKIVAADAHPGRLRTAQKRLRRMGVEPTFVVADGTKPPFRDETFDLVLLDAPCTGLGTLRRRPEIRHRLRSEDPERLGALQRELVEASLRLVRTGGRLIYAVCTLFDEETTGVIDEFGGRPPTIEVGRPHGSGVLLAPHLTDTDGMFISVVDR